MTPLDAVKENFEKTFGRTPQLIVRAPGRVNLIGEHTDYNDGFVLPMAIDRAIWMALTPRDDGRVFLWSVEMGEAQEFDVDDEIVKGDHGWHEYVKGIAWALKEAGHSLNGFDGVMSGNVPIGSGLSSSAALEMATARAFTAISDIDWNSAEMALLGQKVENVYMGVNTGIMDQMISASGQNGHALLIDCRSLDTDAVPVPDGCKVVILDTSMRRGLVDSKYNERREQCEAAAAHFGVAALRDVTLAQFETRADELSDLARRRARHVISENERTVTATEAMRAGDAVLLGQLMNASHVSLRDDFEVSSAELDTMVEIAQAQPGCFGARMTGAGFGGCAVALVSNEAADAFSATVAAEYEGQTGHKAAVYVSVATTGAEVL